MKPLEEAFASGTLRRVVLPGIVLTLGFHPVLATLLAQIVSVYGMSSAVVLITEIIALGLIVSSPVRWIYYVYEGFRLTSLTKWALSFNKKRIRRIESDIRKLLNDHPISDLPYAENNRYLELNEKLLDYPLRQKDGSTEFYAERSTRLGNLISAYELYPDSRYGISGVIFWYHLLYLGSDSARADFEEQYAFGESLVLTSFSGITVAILHTVILAGFMIGKIFPQFVLVHLPIGPKVSFCLILFGIVVWWLFYWFSLAAHREAGASFRSIVDIAIPGFLEWANKINAPLPYKAKLKAQRLAEYLYYLRQTPEEESQAPTPADCILRPR